jgi:hypothetical protein
LRTTTLTEAAFSKYAARFRPVRVADRKTVDTFRNPNLQPIPAKQNSPAGLGSAEPGSIIDRRPEKPKGGDGESPQQLRAVVNQTVVGSNPVLRAKKSHCEFSALLVDAPARTGAKMPNTRRKSLSQQERIAG